MQAKTKSTKAAWFSACGGGGHGKFTGSRKSLADGKELNTLSIYNLYKTLKFKKNPKSKDKDNSDLEYESEHYNFKNMDIVDESDLDWKHEHKEQLGKSNLCTETTMDKKESYHLSKITNPTKKTKIIHNTPVLWGEINGRIGTANFN